MEIWLNSTPPSQGSVIELRKSFALGYALSALGAFSARAIPVATNALVRRLLPIVRAQITADINNPLGPPLLRGIEGVVTLRSQRTRR